MKKRHQSLVHLTALILIVTPLVHGSMIKIDLDTMWEEADLAVLGTVNNIQTSDTGGFYRIVEIEVEGYFIRSLEEQTVRVRIEGTDFGDWGVWIEDQPEFEVGERVFVFLEVPEEITGDYGYEVFGMYQGKWTVDGSTAIRGAESFEIPPYTDIAFTGFPENREISLYGFSQLLLAFLCVVIVGVVLYRVVNR